MVQLRTESSIGIGKEYHEKNLQPLGREMGALRVIWFVNFSEAQYRTFR